MAKGKLIGVGVGPGDPEMMTLKAVRVIRENPVIHGIWHCRPCRAGNGRKRTGSA